MKEDIMLEAMKAEMNNLSKEELVAYMAGKFSELHTSNIQLTSKLEKLNSTVNNSHLFFNLSEIELVSSSKLPRIIIDASDPVGIDANLHPAEAWEHGSFRWIGPHRLTKFFIPISRNVERTLILRLFSQVTEGMYGSMKLYIDGDLVEHDIELKGNSADIFVTLPISDRVQDTVFGIFLPKLFSPSELSEELSDSRVLGVAFTQIEVL
jgi:hypothetical protein